MANASDDEDDYLSMTFGDTKTSTVPETSLQRTIRLKKEASERARIPSKAELAAQEKSQRENALATHLSSTNKGAQIMAKMGFQGGTLGQSDDARTQPIELQLKDDRGGIGMDSEKKRKVREAAESLQEGEKRQRVGMEEFRARNGAEREERRAEGQMWGAMKVLEGLETERDIEERQSFESDEDQTAATPAIAPLKHLRDVNVLYRPLLKRRLEKEREREMRHQLNSTLSNRDDEVEDDAATFDPRADELDEDDPELADFEAQTFAERLEKIVGELREKYRYCFWCKCLYADGEMEGCPGLTEDEHG